jgi:hypothetical protein
MATIAATSYCTSKREMYHIRCRCYYSPKNLPYCLRDQHLICCVVINYYELDDAHDTTKRDMS